MSQRPVDQLSVISERTEPTTDTSSVSSKPHSEENEFGPPVSQFVTIIKGFFDRAGGKFFSIEGLGTPASQFRKWHGQYAKDIEELEQDPGFKETELYTELLNVLSKIYTNSYYAGKIHIPI